MTKRLRTGAEFSKTINNDPMKKNLVLLKILFQCGCVWPETTNRILIIIGCINTASCGLLNLCLIFDLINSEYISIQSLSYLTGVLQMTIKITSLIMYRKKLQKIVLKIWFQFLPIKIAASQVQSKLNYSAKLIRRIICSYIFVFSACVLDFVFVELITGGRELPYPLNFMPKSSPLYELIYFCEIFTASFAGIFGASMDLLFVTLVAICVTQFQIINSNLKLVGSDDDGKLIVDFNGTNQKVQKNIFVRRFINQYVAQHSMLTEVCLELAKVFQYIMLIQVLSTTTTACFSGLTMKLHPEEIVQCCFIPVVAFFQLALYCWVSEQLTYHSQNSAIAAYDSAWYNIKELELRKSLILIIQKSNEELAMTAGGFSKISLNTLVQVSKFCVSLYTLMGKVMEKADVNSN